MQEPQHNDDAPRSGRAWVWPVAVVGMLSVSMTVCAITVIAAVSDPSYAIENDYYQKAVDWDQSREIQRASEQLGWECDATLVTDRGVLTITLQDEEGVWITDASVRATVFHHARRGDAQQLVLTSQGDGSYTAVLKRPREGQWQVRLRASRGRDQFVHTQDFVSRKGAP